MIAFIGLLSVFLLILAWVPVGLAMLGVGFVAFTSLTGLRPASFMTAQTTFATVNSYSLSVVPLFLLMGNLINRSRISTDLYDAANAGFGHFVVGWPTRPSWPVVDSPQYRGPVCPPPPRWGSSPTRR